MHNACALPREKDVSTRGLIDSLINFVWGGVSAITDAALSIFSNVMQNLGTLVNTTVTGINTLANDTLQAVSQTTKAALDAFNKLVAIPAGIGSQIQDALKNRDASSGLSAITNQINSLLSALGSAVNMTALVDPAAGAAIQKDLANLGALANAILANVSAAAKAATSGLNMFFPQPLIKVLGDPTLRGIQEAIKFGVGVMNNATSAFVAAVQNNPFTTFVNDVLIAPTKDALTSALAGIQKIIGQAIDTATKTANGTISTALDGLSKLVPAVVSNITQIISNANSTIATAVSQAKTLSAGARAAVQKQIQAAVGNLSQLVGGLQSNLTQAIQGAVGQILSNVQGSVTNVTGLAQDLAKQVVTALITSKLQAKATAIATLAQLLPIAQNGLTNLINCTAQAAAAVQNNTNAIVAAVNGTAALLAQNMQTCLSQTTEVAVLSCVNVSVWMFIRLKFRTN